MGQLLTILAGFGAIVGVIMLLYRPHWTVVLVICTFPLEQLLQAYFGIFLELKWLVNVGIGVLAGIAVISRIMRGEQVLSGVVNTVAVSCLILYLMAWVGLLWTPSLERATELMHTSVYRAALTFICLPLLVDDLRDFRRIAIGVMLVGTITAILIMLNPVSSFSGGRMTFEFSAMNRGRSNPGALASLGGVMALMAALVRFDRVTSLLNLLRIAAFTTGLGMAIVAGSRGQVLFACVLSVALYPVARRIANPRQFILFAVGFAVVMVGVAVVFTLFVGEINQDRWDVSKMGTASLTRLEFIRSLAEAYFEDPGSWLFGLGTNAFTTVSGFPDVPYVHNIIAEALFEQGIVGAAALIVVLVATYRAGRTLWTRNAEDPSLRSVAALLAGLALYQFFLFLKETSFAVAPDSFMWFLVLARIAANEARMFVPGTATAGEPETLDHPGEDLDTLSDYGDFADYGEEYVSEA